MGTQCVQGPQQNNYDAAIQEPCPQQIRVLLPSLESNRDRGHQSHRISPKNRERYLIIHMWKVRMAQVPNDLNIKLHYNDRLGLKAIVPKAPQSHVGSVYQNSFAVKGPRLWNMLPVTCSKAGGPLQLPKDLTLADNLDSFKTNLDRLLLSFRDTPPISGDETQIPNSLLDRPGKRDNRMLPAQADDCRVRRPRPGLASGSLT